jgi:hypothetical protein
VEFSFGWQAYGMGKFFYKSFSIYLSTRVDREVAILFIAFIEFPIANTEQTISVNIELTQLFN